MAVIVSRESPTWVSTGDVDFPYKVVTSQYQALMAGRLNAGVGDSLLWCMQVQGYNLCYAPESIAYIDHAGNFDVLADLTDIPAVVDGDTVTFTHPLYVVRYQALVDRLKLTIRLNAPLREPNPAFVTPETAMLTLTGGIVLPFELDVRDRYGVVREGDWGTAGEIYLYDPTTQQPVQYMARITAEDAQGNPGYGEFRIATDVDGMRRLYYGLSWNWLRVAEYPVDIDPTVVTTSLATNTLGSNSSVVCSNGNAVDFWVSTDTFTIRYAVSSDGWSSPPDASVNTGVNASGFSVDIDDQDNIHLFYFRAPSTTYTFYYRRLTPNAGRTSWTLGAETNVSVSSYDGFSWGRLGIIVHSEGTGLKAHCFYNPVNAGTYSMLYKALTISNTGTVTVGSLTTLASDATHSVAFGNVSIGGASGKDLVVTWCGGASFDLRYKRATYSAGSWTFGSTVTISTVLPTSQIMGVYLHTNNDFDVVYRGVSGDLKHLRVTNGGIVTANTIASGVVNAGGVAMSCDSFGNLLTYYQTTTTGNAMVERTYVRSTNAWSASETVVGSSSATSGQNPSMKRGYGGNKIDVLFFEGTSHPYNIVHYRRSLNSEPLMPSGLSPSGGYAFDGTQTQVFSATFNDSDVGAYATAYADEWKENVVGATVIQTGKVAITSGIPYAGQPYSANRTGGTFANGKDWQWRRQYWDQWDRQGVWSDWETFRTSAKPTTSIISPADDATLNTSSVTVAWAVSDPESRGQGWYRVKFYNSDRSATLWDTDWTQSTTDFLRTIGYAPATLTTYQIGVQTKDTDGIASDEVYITLSFDYTPVPTPVASATAESDSGYIDVSWTNPTPVSPEPDVSHNDLYRSEDGGVTYTRIATELPADYAYRDYAVASGNTYHYKVRAVGENNTTADSNVVSASVTLNYLWIHDPLDAMGTVHAFQYREVNVNDTPRVKSGAFQFVGRAYPVVNFDGQAKERNLRVRIAIPDETDDRAAMENFLDRRRTLCMRDQRGRKVFGVLRELPITDERWGGWVECDFMAVDYTEAV